MFANPLLVLVAFIVFYSSCIKILREYERGVIFRLGRLLPKPKGPGIIFVFKPVDKMVRVSLRLLALDVPPQDIITKDNVSVQVNAVIYFRDGSEQGDNRGGKLRFATSQMAQTTSSQRRGRKRTRRATLRPRSDQRSASGYPRQADRSVGNQGIEC